MFLIILNEEKKNSLQVWPSATDVFPGGVGEEEEKKDSLNVKFEFIRMN